MLANLPLLSLLIWTPIVGGALCLVTGYRQLTLTKWIGLFTALLSVALCIPLWCDFNVATSAMQFAEDLPWISQYGIRYSLGVDGISMPLIVLTAYTNLIIVIAAWKSIKDELPKYLAAFLIMQGATVGVFAAVDSILFYTFWEAMLIPMYLCIGVWGGENRTYSAVKFFLYTFFGSALMLVALLYLGIEANNFSILSFYDLKISLPIQLLIFAAFFLAFAVKVPMFPVHTWLPDAHTQAPTGGSVILAALLLKLGAYGFFRFSLPITPDASHYLQWFMITLSLIAIVYISMVAIAQKDMKRLIAYSSIAHMGFCTLGAFVIFLIVENTHKMASAYMGLEGALVQMISHGFSSGALFLGFGMLYDRLHTRKIEDFGGVATSMPIFAAFFMVFAMANVGLPGTSGFVGEFMVILSALQANFWIAILAALSLIVGATYTLWMYKRVFFGEIVSDGVKNLKDIDRTEIFMLLLLTVPIIVIGLYPEALLKPIHSSVAHLLDLSMKSHL